MKIYFTTRLKNGIPVFDPCEDIDKKAFNGFRMSCDKDQLVSMELQKVKKREYDMYKRNAHYFSYLREVISNHDISNDGIILDEFHIPKKSPHAQVQALHDQLKTRALKAHPELLRTIKDKDGNPTYHQFSLRVDTRKKDPFVLNPKERSVYYEFTFDLLMSLQDSAAGWHIPAYTEVA